MIVYIDYDIPIFVDMKVVKRNSLRNWARYLIESDRED